MRLRLSLLAVLLLGTLPVAAVTIRDAYSRPMQEGQFQLLREFFTGEESTGNRLVLRTEASQREGQYFVLRLDTRLEELPPGAEFVVEVVSTEAVAPVTHTFILPGEEKPRARQVLLGLTGDAWPGEEAKALAWRVRIDAGGATLAEWKSFLWEMP
jgi:hypothetical protein